MRPTGRQPVLCFWDASLLRRETDTGKSQYSFVKSQGADATNRAELPLALYYAGELGGADATKWAVWLTRSSGILFVNECDQTGAMLF